MEIEMTKREKLFLKLQVQCIVHPEMVRDCGYAIGSVIGGQISAHAQKRFFEKCGMRKSAKYCALFSTKSFILVHTAVAVVGIVQREQKRHEIAILVKRMAELKKDII